MHPLSPEQSGILLQVRISMCLIFQFPPAIKISNCSHSSHLKHPIQESDNCTHLNDRLGFLFGLLSFVEVFFPPSLKESVGRSLINCD